MDNKKQQMSEGSESKPKYDFIKKRVYIRDATPVPDKSGEYYFKFSPLNENEKEQEIIAKIDMTNPLHRDMLQRIADNEMDITTVNLRYNSSNPEEIPYISSIEPGLSKEERQIELNGKHASTWTGLVDHALDVHYQYCAYQRTNDALKEITEDPELIKSIVSDAKDQWEEFCDARNIDPDEFTSPNKWDDIEIETILEGRENGQNIRYNTDVDFSKQVKLDPSMHAEIVESYKNYALQKSLNNKIVKEAIKDVTIDEDSRSFLGHAQKQLIKDRTLFAGHPTRTEEDHKALSKEYIEMVSSLNLQGLMDYNGAQPASQQHDSVLKTIGDDGQTVKDPFLQEIQHRARNTELDDTSPKGQLNNYIENAKELSDIAIEDTKKPLRVVVDQSMRPGFSRMGSKTVTKDPERIGSAVSHDIVDGIDKGLSMSAF